MGTLGCFNKCLEDKTYLVAERISIADFFRAYVSQQIFETLTEKEAAAYGNVIRHLKTVAANFPAFEEVCGKLVFAQHSFQLKANKPEKPKKEEKQEAPVAEERQERPEPKKPKYEYKMNLDEWKRHYKNLDWEKEDWQDYFYKHFDGTDMSLWFIVYKDPSSFKVDW